jgi:hypothetical protein
MKPSSLTSRYSERLNERRSRARGQGHEAVSASAKSKR